MKHRTIEQPIALISKQSADDLEQEPLLEGKRLGSLDSCEPGGGLSFFGAVFALTCTSCGAGIVTVPRAFSLAGYGTGFIILSTVASLSVMSLNCLFHCARIDRGCSSYQALAHKYLPGELSVLIEFAIGALLLGAIGTTFLLATHVLCSAQLAISSHSISEDVLSLSLFAAVLPISLARNFAALRWVNAVNLSCTLGVVFIICWTSMSIMSSRTPSKQHSVSSTVAPGFSFATSSGGVLAALPIMLYVFFNQICAPQLYSELHPQWKESACLAGSIATCFCSVLYIAVGMLGYAAFGAATGGDILAQLHIQDSTDRFLCVGQALFGIVLLCSTPLLLTPLRAMVVGRLISDSQIAPAPFKLHLSITSSILMIALLIARIVPWVDLLMGILGATSVAFLALTIPGLLAIRCLSRSVDIFAGYVLFGSGCVFTPLTLAALAMKHLGTLQ